MKDGLKGH